MQFKMTGLLILNVACTILIALTTRQNIGVLGYEVIQDNGCHKVLLQAPNHKLGSGEDQCCLEEAPCSDDGESKTCCDKNTQACCDGYGCVDPCESQFDAIGCQLSDLSLSSGSAEGSAEGSDEGNGYTFGKRLFRILRPDEFPEGIVAKNPSATRTVLSHVNCGSRPKYTSQYISTTASLDVAKYYKSKGETEKGLTGLRIAEINLDNLPKGCTLEIVDLTTEEKRDEYLGNAVCKNFAKASCEVLLKCDVPIPCTVIDPSEEKKSLKDFGEL